MAKRPSPQSTPKRQVETFRKAAHKLGCDQSEERFQAALRTIAKAKPKPQPKQPKDK